MTAVPPAIAELFPGPVKGRILYELAKASPEVIYAADLCARVFGNAEKAHRDTLKSLIVQMKPTLAAHGYAIRGRKDLHVNGYVLVNTLLG